MEQIISELNQQQVSYIIPFQAEILLQKLLKDFHKIQSFSKLDSSTDFLTNFKQALVLLQLP